MEELTCNFEVEFKTSLCKKRIWEMQIEINDLQIFLWWRAKVMKYLHVPCVQDASYPARQKGQKCIPYYTYHLLSTQLQIWESVAYMAFCTIFYRSQDYLINLIQHLNNQIIFHFSCRQTSISSSSVLSSVSSCSQPTPYLLTPLPLPGEVKALCLTIRDGSGY